MKFPISIYQDEDGMYFAECPVIPGCVSQGQQIQPKRSRSVGSWLPEGLVFDRLDS